MLKNSYEELLRIVSDVSVAANSPVMQIGTVLQSPPDIKVSYKNIILESPELYISEYLLTEYARTTRGHLVSATQYRAGGGGDAAYASHNHDIDNDYTETIITTDTLVPGDKVAIMPVPSEDGTNQAYIILDKLVRPDRRTF